MASNNQQQSPAIIDDNSMKMPANMNVLPNEVLLIIFKHLKMQDLIQCRLVCKRFMFVCDEVKITELIISNKIENMKDVWFYTNRKFNHKDAIEISTFTTYRSTFRFDMILKRLHFSGDYSDFDRLDLNSLTQLEQLQIDMTVPYRYASKFFEVNLPNLKMLEVRSKGSPDPRKFHLTTPKLEILKYYDFDRIRITDPSTINHLVVTFYGKQAHLLKNVQYLKADWRLLPYDDILSVHPKLTTLVCNEFDNNYIREGASMNTLRHLVKQKSILRRPEFKIYFQSVELVETQKIDECLSAESMLAFQINNRNLLLDDISFHHNCNYCDYNELMRVANGELPEDIRSKCSKIRRIFVSNVKVEGQEHLVWFLYSLDYLNTLYLKNTFLDQNFYDVQHGQPKRINGGKEFEADHQL